MEELSKQDVLCKPAHRLVAIGRVGIVSRGGRWGDGLVVRLQELRRLVLGGLWHLLDHGGEGGWVKV